MQKTVIAIVSFNAKRYMQECIQSIREKVASETYLISVVDNASTDGITDWLAEQSDILLTRNDINIGFGPACNQAVRATEGTEFEDADVFLLNNDTVMTSTALPRMIDTLYSSDDIGAVGAMGNYAGNRQQIDVNFPSTDDYIRFGEGIQVPEADRRLEKVRLNGFAMLVRRNVWNSVGGFDEDFAPGYYEDDALSIEILKLGYRLILSRDSFIYHVGSASFVKTGTNRLSFEHHALFIQKYGFDILDYVYPCGAVMSQIPYGRLDSFNVLHLGCGLGAELKAIKSLFPNANTIGIEKDDILRDISCKTENVFSSIEEAAAALRENSIDLLIVDSIFLETITDSEKELLVSRCKESAVEINRLHDYDDFPFDQIKLVLWDSSDFNQAVADLWSNWGIMNITYTNDNFKSRVRAYGINYENILFISSNPSFRGNAFFMIPSLLNANPAIIPYVTAHFGRLTASDPGHINAQRLAIFERKQLDAKGFSSYKEFLNSSEITISFGRDCLANVRRILEIINEHSLLDYTKKDFDETHLRRLLTNDWNDCAYITAMDKYADYGIVGFYCYNQREQQFIIFAFSWIITGTGIEQYVYRRLGCPDLIAVGPVRSKPQEDADISHIHEIPGSFTEDPAKQGGIKILLKGNRNLHSIEDYLIGGHITTEYDSPGSKLPTRLFTAPYHIIIYSLLQEDFSSWEQNSDTKLAELFETLENLCNQTLGDPTVILLLGAEAAYGSNTENDKKLAELHSELNPIIYDFALDSPKIRTINVTDYIRDQSDFDGSVNQFSVRVYSDIVERIVVYINEKIDSLTSQ